MELGTFASLWGKSGGALWVRTMTIVEISSDSRFEESNAFLALKMVTQYKNGGCSVSRELTTCTGTLPDSDARSFWYRTDPQHGRPHVYAS